MMRKKWIHSINISITIYMLILLTTYGCAFDLRNIKYAPVEFAQVSSTVRTFLLGDDFALKNLPCGYNRILKKDNKWKMVGRIEQGDVYKSVDQCFTVECSNVFEAYLVMKGKLLYGFYLPVEKGYINLKNPVELPIIQQ